MTSWFSRSIKVRYIINCRVSIKSFRCTVYCTALEVDHVNFLLREAQLSRRDCAMRWLLKSCQMLYECTKNRIWKGLQSVSDVEGRSRSWEIARFEVRYHFLLVVCNSNVSALHCVRDIISFTVYVTASDLHKCFNFHMTVEITCNVYAFWFVYKHVVGNTWCIFRGVGVIQILSW